MAAYSFNLVLLLSILLVDTSMLDSMKLYAPREPWLDMKKQRKLVKLHGESVQLFSLISATMWSVSQSQNLVTSTLKRKLKDTQKEPQTIF